MEYTVQKLAVLAGISARALRHYDAIGLLTPPKNESGYRCYGTLEVDRLQQILLYRELGFRLDAIARLLDDPEFDEVQALAEHHKELIAKRSRLDLLIENVETTISAKRGERHMSDHEKFEGFKQQLVTDNEDAYGSEIRRKYGDRLVDASNAKLLGMNKERYEAFCKLEQDILDKLGMALGSDPRKSAGQEIAALHKEWLNFTWPSYDPEAHRGLAEMYAADERFAAYYNKAGAGAAQFLRDAIVCYTE